MFIILVVCLEMDNAYSYIFTDHTSYLQKQAEHVTLKVLDLSISPEKCKIYQEKLKLLRRQCRYECYVPAFKLKKL